MSPTRRAWLAAAVGIVADVVIWTLIIVEGKL